MESLPSFGKLVQEMPPSDISQGRGFCCCSRCSAQNMSSSVFEAGQCGIICRVLCMLPSAGELLVALADTAEALTEAAASNCWLLGSGSDRLCEE